MRVFGPPRSSGGLCFVPVTRQVPIFPAYIKTGDALLSVKSFRRFAVSREEFDRSPVLISRPLVVAILWLAAFFCVCFSGRSPLGKGTCAGCS